MAVFVWLMCVQEGLICDHLRETHARGAKLEFDRERKLMSVMATRGSRTLMFVKGAPESVVQRCTHSIDESGAFRWRLPTPPLLYNVTSYASSWHAVGTPSFRVA